MDCGNGWSGRPEIAANLMRRLQFHTSPLSVPAFISFTSFTSFARHVWCEAGEAFKSLSVKELSSFLDFLRCIRDLPLEVPSCTKLLYELI